jgi:hypothetical protein
MIEAGYILYDQWKSMPLLHNLVAINASPQDMPHQEESKIPSEVPKTAAEALF